MSVERLLLIIFEIILIGLTTGVGIYYWKESMGKILLFLVLPVFLFSFSLTAFTGNKGSSKLYKVAVDELGMKYKEKSMSSGTYQKDNMIIDYYESGFTYKYTITDIAGNNFDKHLKVLNCFFDFKTNAPEMFYSHLLDYYNKSGTKTKIIIMDNHIKLEVEYDIKSEKIIYYIELERYVNDEKKDEIGNVIEKIYNDNYDKLYLFPELYISHYSDDTTSDEFDKKLLSELFGKNELSFYKEINGNDVIYKYKYKYKY